MASGAAAIVTSDGGMAAPFQAFGPPAYMGCSIGDGRERLLARYDFQDYDSETGAIQAAAAGNYAALATFDTDAHYGGSSEAVAVYDLRSGNALADRGGETVGCEDYEYGCFSSLDDVVINSQGYTAAHTTVFGDCAYPEGSPCPAEQIQVSDSLGIRAVDTAPTAPGPPELSDLALSGDTLTWTHAGAPESVQLR